MRWVRSRASIRTESYVGAYGRLHDTPLLNGARPRAPPPLLIRQGLGNPSKSSSRDTAVGRVRICWLSHASSISEYSLIFFALKSPGSRGESSENATGSFSLRVAGLSPVRFGDSQKRLPGAECVREAGEIASHPLCQWWLLGRRHLPSASLQMPEGPPISIGSRVSFSTGGAALQRDRDCQ